MLPAQLRAQVSEPSDIQRDKNTVSVPVTVSDREGRYIPGLKKENFSIFRNGQKQNVTYFGKFDEPLNIVLLLDTSGSTNDAIPKIKEAAKNFIGLLNPADECMLATFDSEINILHDFTIDRGALSKSLERVQTAGQDGTVLFQAIEKIVQSSFTNAKGRKVVIVLSDGKDFGSQMTKQSVMSLLEESDVLIYSIFYKTGGAVKDLVIAKDGSVREKLTTKKEKKPKVKKSKGYSVTIPAQEDVPNQSQIDLREKKENIDAVNFLKDLSDTTAGRFYLSDAPDLKKIFVNIADELRQYYWLGYRSKETVGRAGVFDIEVKVDRPDVVVRTRGKFRAKQL